MPRQGFWNQVAQGANQAGQQMKMPAQGGSTAPKAPTFTPQPVPKPNQLSPYAQLMAQAIDLNPPLAQVPQPYYQQQPVMTPQPMYGGPATVQQQLNPINDQFRKLVLGR